MSNFITVGKSKQFYNFLRNLIISGEYRTGDKFPSMRELAAKYEINKMTVNSVVSTLVSEGYLRVEEGRGTFVERTSIINKSMRKMIGVMFIELDTDPTSEYLMLGGIQQAFCNSHNGDYFIVPYMSKGRNDDFYRGLQLFSDLNVDGIIMLPPQDESYSHEAVVGIIGTKLPVVCINRYIGGADYSYIYVDYFKGIRDAAVYLIQSGRKKIVLNTSPFISRTLRKMMTDGYIAAHHELSVAYDAERIDKTGFPEDADALITSDMEIFRYQKHFIEHNIKIPEQLALVGINDSGYAKIMQPSLTVIRYPAVEIGEHAAVLIDAMQNGAPPEKMAVNPEIIIRKST